MIFGVKVPINKVFGITGVEDPTANDCSDALDVYEAVFDGRIEDVYAMIPDKGEADKVIELCREWLAYRPDKRF